MPDFTARTAARLPVLLRGFRRQSGLNLTYVARRLRISQRALSNLERQANKVSADPLLELLSLLGVELVPRDASETLQ